MLIPNEKHTKEKNTVTIHKILHKILEVIKLFYEKGYRFNNDKDFYLRKIAELIKDNFDNHYENKDTFAFLFPNKFGVILTEKVTAPCLRLSLDHFFDPLWIITAWVHWI